jgi:tryptophanyl-tRNA synthetase
VVNNAIFLNDEPSVIEKKMMRAVTDTGPTVPNQEKPDAIKNLFTIMQHVSTADTYKHFDDLYNNCTIRYGDLKKQLASDITAFLTPIRERILVIENDRAYLEKMMKMGAEKAKASAEKTMAEVRKAIKFLS